MFLYVFLCDKLCDLSCIIPLYAKLALVLGDFFPFIETVATDRRPQDDSQTDQVPDQLYYYYDILFLLIYQSFFCC